MTAFAWLAFGVFHGVADRRFTALVHVAAAVGCVIGFATVGKAFRGGAILVIVVASVLGLAGSAVIAGEPHGLAAELLLLVPLVTGSVNITWVRRAVLGASLVAIVTVPLAASRWGGWEPLRFGILEGVVSSAGLCLLVYRFGAEWRWQSDAHTRHVAEQRQAVADARDAAVQASLAKSRFVSITSHEIRGPLNGLSGLGHALADTDLSPHQRELVDSLLLASGSLARVVGELLDVARVEAGKIDIERTPVDPGELLDDVADTFAASASERGLALGVVVARDVPRALSLDRQRVQQVASNLLANAIKFTDAGSVELRASWADGTLTVEVEDTGRGMSDDEVARLFSPFEQVSDKLVDRRAGTGLGLWLSRSFVDAMEGTVTVDSQSGRGTRFVVRIPADALPSDDGRVSSEGVAVLFVSSSPLATRAFDASAARLGLVCHAVTRAEEISAEVAYVAAIVDADGGDARARADAVVRALPEGTPVHFAASPPRVSSAAALARDLGLAGVTLLPPRATRLAALLSRRRAPTPSTPGEIGSLLVVDDEPINRLVARRLATGLGFAVEDVPSGQSALEVLRERSFDVVLLDLHMDGIDGAETAKRMKTLDRPPVIVGYTGVVADEDRGRLLRAGAIEIVQKPLDRGVFEAALRRALAKAQR